MDVRLKRVYEAPEDSDGLRILIDRIWPRGLTKQAAAIDLWLKDIAPTTELRKWFNHNPAKWSQFQTRYTAELESNPEAVQQLTSLLNQSITTLIYGAKDEQHNHAVVLAGYLKQQTLKQ